MSSLLYSLFLSNCIVVFILFVCVSYYVSIVVFYIDGFKVLSVNFEVDISFPLGNYAVEMSSFAYLW